MDIIQYIKDKIKDYDINIATEEGTVLNDLMIKPLSAILEDSLNYEQNLLNKLSISDPSKLTEEEMDKIAENFGVYRDYGGVARGYIKLFYNTPVELNLPKGTFFKTSSGIKFKTSTSFFISASSMFSNSSNYPFFDTGNIAIEGIDGGDEFNVSANKITLAISTINPTPVAIRNPLPITSGVRKESNTELKTKILNSINNKSIASEGGIKNVILNLVPTIEDIKIVGAGDTGMVRDIVYSSVNIGTYFTSDFNGKAAGLTGYPYNSSEAYYLMYRDEDETEDISFPEIEDFSQEFTNDMYKGIFNMDDPDYAELNVYKVLEEDFSDPYVESRNWISSDTGSEEFGEVLKLNEIKVLNGELRMGTFVPVVEDPVEQESNVRLPGAN